MEILMSRSVGEGAPPPAEEVLGAPPGDVGTGRGEGRATGGDGVTALDAETVGSPARPGPSSDADVGTPVDAEEGEVTVETPSRSDRDPPEATNATVSATANNAPMAPRTTTPPGRLGAR